MSECLAHSCISVGVSVYVERSLACGLAFGFGLLIIVIILFIVVVLLGSHDFVIGKHGFLSLLLGFFLLLFKGGILAQLAEEVAHHECSQAVDVEDLTHEPKVNVWHFKVAVVLLTGEVCALRPHQDNTVENE